MAEKALRAGLASGASGNAGQEATSPGVPAAPAQQQRCGARLSWSSGRSMSLNAALSFRRSSESDEVLQKRKFSDRLRSEIGRLDVKDIVTDSRGRLTLEVRDALNSGSAGTEDEVSTPAADDAIAKAAERVEAETNGKVQVINPNSMAALGIEVVDVRIKQINLPAEVSEAIYNRMRAEREAVARRHRSQGQEEAEKLRATADYEVTKTLAEAERQGRILRGEGDAESAKLFADAFSQDPGFYSFIRSLRAYEKSFQSNQDVMVLSPDSDFFRYMKSPASATR